MALVFDPIRGMLLQKAPNYVSCPAYSPSMLGVCESLGMPARMSLPQRHSLNNRCRPETEFSESAEAYYLLVKLPGGFEKEHLTVSVDAGERNLTVAGQRTSLQLDYFSGQAVRVPGPAFRRVYQIPSNVDGGRVSAELRRSVLVIRLPKIPKERLVYKVDIATPEAKNMAAPLMSCTCISIQRPSTQDVKQPEPKTAKGQDGAEETDMPALMDDMPALIDPSADESSVPALTDAPAAAVDENAPPAEQPAAADLLFGAVLESLAQAVRAAVDAPENSNLKPLAKAVHPALAKEAKISESHTPAEKDNDARPAPPAPAEEPLTIPIESVPSPPPASLPEPAATTTDPVNNAVEANPAAPDSPKSAGAGAGSKSPAEESANADEPGETSEEKDGSWVDVSDEEQKDSSKGKAPLKASILEAVDYEAEADLLRRRPQSYTSDSD